MRSFFRSEILAEMSSISNLLRTFSPDELEDLCSPRLSLEMLLRLLHDFHPGLSGTFEDEIIFQKRNPS